MLCLTCRFPFDVHRIHKWLGDVHGFSANVYAYVMLLLRTFCNLWLISHECNSNLWKTHSVTSVSDSKNFIQLFASFPLRDHPFKTSAFFREEGSKIWQRNVVKMPTEGSRGQNSWKIVDVFNGWYHIIFLKLFQSQYEYRISSYSCRSNYSFLNSSSEETRGWVSKFATHKLPFYHPF